MRAHAALTRAARLQGSIHLLGDKSFAAARVFRTTAAPQLRSRSSKLACKAAQAGVPGDGSLPRDPPQGPAKLLLSGVIKAYNDALTKHPVATKAVTSLIGFAVGDRIAQAFGGGPFDIYRFLRLSAYGLLIDGPIGHYFYQFLDTRIRPDDPKSTPAVLTKTAIDQLLWAPAMTVVFLAFLTTLEGRPDAIAGVVQAKLVPIYLANLGIWPLWHIINFRYVPPEQRILFNNIVAIAWTTYLSWTCGHPGGGGHAGTPRDVLAAGLPCAAQAGWAMLQSHHVADAVRQTSAVESMLGGWGAEGLPDAEAGAELMVNYAAMKAEVVRTVCSLPPGATLP